MSNSILGAFVALCRSVGKGCIGGKSTDARIQWVKYIVTVSAIGSLLIYNSLHLGYRWQWYRVLRHLFAVGEFGLEPGPLLQGVAVTVRISLFGLVLSSLIGLAAALLKLSQSVVGKLIAGMYVEAVRNTPLLIQLLFFYFVIAPIFGVSPFMSAVLALSLFEGAYASEIIRGGIMAIPRGQWEAARSIGMSVRQTYRHVILPQALRVVMPPLAGQAVSLVKDSALVSVIAIYDLTMQGQAIVSETFLTFEIWFTVALLYLSMTLSLSYFVRRWEKKLGDVV